MLTFNPQRGPMYILILICKETHFTFLWPWDNKIICCLKVMISAILECVSVYWAGKPHGTVSLWYQLSVTSHCSWVWFPYIGPHKSNHSISVFTRFLCSVSFLNVEVSQVVSGIAFLLTLIYFLPQSIIHAFSFHYQYTMIPTSTFWAQTFLGLF